jgi:lipid-A-disaccharide synthase
MVQRIFFSVGEPSGDQHTARLIGELRRRHPGLRFRGFGGPEMRQAGCQLDFELTELAVMGVIEVLPMLRKFFRLAAQAEEAFAAGDVDAVVLADFPGFNWHIARRAKKYGIPVSYYLPPQLWAWGGWRVRKMRRSVDQVLSVLPFECDWYRSHGVHAELVGHPFFDAVADCQLDRAVTDRLQESINQGARLVAVLPGSREHEVQRNWPVMLAAIRRLARQHPQVRFLVAAFRDPQCLWIRRQLEEVDRDLPIDFFVGKTSEVIEKAECAMMVSGSVSLEMMARDTPAVVLYRVGRVFYATAKALVRVDSMTLPNLMAGETLFPELGSVGPPQPAVDFLVHELDRMLSDAPYCQSLRHRLAELRQAAAAPGASARAAEALLQHWQPLERRRQAA